MNRPASATIRRIDSWSRVDHAVGGVDAHYERAPGYAEVIRGIHAAPEKMALLRALHRPMRVEEPAASTVAMAA